MRQRDAAAPRRGEEQDRRAAEDPEGGDGEGHGEPLRGLDTGGDQGCATGADPHGRARGTDR